MFLFLPLHSAKFSLNLKTMTSINFQIDLWKKFIKVISLFLFILRGIIFPQHRKTSHISSVITKKVRPVEEHNRLKSPLIVGAFAE